MSSCICSCDGVESLGACAAPKTPVGSPLDGEITICNSLNDGIGFGNFPVIMISGCKFVGSIERSDSSNAWLFNFVGVASGIGGAVAVFPDTPDPSCEGFAVKWGLSPGGVPFITVRGKSSPPSGPTNILDGTAYAVAGIGNAWALLPSVVGLMLFEDQDGMTFEDAQPMQFSI